MVQWLRRWHERDDRPLVKRGEPLPDIDPIEELIRILGEANANSFSAGDIRGVREFKRRGPKPTCATIGTTSILQAT